MKKAKYIVLLAFAALSSCGPDNGIDSDCFIPDVNVNLTINMDLPEYFKLQNLGEYIAFDAGHRGVYVIHNYDNYFYVLERTCPYKSDNECARVEIDDEVLQIRCGTTVDTGFVQCCASTYSFNSGFLTGPTRCNLKTYRVSRSGNTLYVSN